MIPAYIAGPYAGPTPEAVAENVRRAAALARWATEAGYAPECVHASIAAGCYGDDQDPKDRERGLRICEARVRMTATAGGALLIILRDDRTPSSGTARELTAFQNAGGVECIARTWAQWLTFGVRS